MDLLLSFSHNCSIGPLSKWLSIQFICNEVSTFFRSMQYCVNWL